MIKRYCEYMLENVQLDRDLISCSIWGATSQEVQELINKGANIEHKDTDGDTPIIIASKRYIDVVKVLLDNNANIEAEDEQGRTSLFTACIYGHKEIVKLLLDRGANIEHKDHYNETVLGNIAMHSESGDHKTSDKEVSDITILLEYGADINTADQFGEPCLNYIKYIWKMPYIQELIITGQPHNIKLFGDKIGILPSLKKKYKEVIEMSEIGIFW